jgi:nucleotide-binding universal stress UspA family protein
MDGYPSLAQRILLQNIVLATDFSASSLSAVHYATSIANHYGGKVYVVHVITPEVSQRVPPETNHEFEKSIRAEAERQMKAVLESKDLQSVPHEGVLKNGEVWDALHEFLFERHIHLIVTGTRGRRGLRKLIMGSVAEEIFRLSPVPVLTARPDVRRRDPDFRTILYPIDFSTDSVRAMAYALSLAQEFQSRVVFLHVAPISGDDPGVRLRLREFFSGQLRQIIPPETSSWCQQELVVEFGSPAEAICKSADIYNADLIIMGVRGAGSLARASTHIGSTAYQVVSEARAPVLSVRQIQQDLLK